jgi:hypothetical protein
MSTKTKTETRKAKITHPNCHVWRGGQLRRLAVGEVAELTDEEFRRFGAAGRAESIED